MSFFGLGNFSKTGKGVGKNEAQKRTFFDFFERFFRNFGKMIKVHIVYLIFCIPIITIGPATVALSKIMHYYATGEHVFLFHDFFEETKKNFKQGIVLWLFNSVVTVLLYIAIDYYAGQTSLGVFMFILIGLQLFMAILFSFSLCYSYLLSGLVKMSVFTVIKNSFLLGVLGFKGSVASLFFGILLSLPAIYFMLLFPPFILVLAPHAAIAFTASYNAFPVIYRYIIKPYYDQTGEKNPYEDEETEATEEEVLFTDAPELEKVKKGNKKKNTVEKAGRNKTIS